MRMMAVLMPMNSYCSDLVLSNDSPCFANRDHQLQAMVAESQKKHTASHRYVTLLRLCKDVFEQVVNTVCLSRVNKYVETMVLFWIG